MTNPVKLLYVTCKDTEEARMVGREITANRLAACVNIFPAMESIYEWESRIETTSETVMIVKTSQQMVDQCADRIRKLHSYKTPCVLIIPVENSDDSFVRWMQGQLGGR
jgi:periplasmic divalent cation tolerance protein